MEQYRGSSKIKLPYDPAIPLLGIYLKEKNPLSQRDICTPLFTAALFINTIAKTWKQLGVHQGRNG